MLKKIITLSLPLVLFTQNAHADQCALVSEGQAKAAIEFIKTGEALGTLCEPCGDLVTELGGPSFPDVVETVALKEYTLEHNQMYNEVIVNGKGIDLAYTYVVTARTEGQTVSMNLAYLVGCYTEGVTPRFLIGE